MTTFEGNASIPPWTCPFIKSTPWVAPWKNVPVFQLMSKLCCIAHTSKQYGSQLQISDVLGVIRKSCAALVYFTKCSRICCHACQLSRLEQSSSFEYYGIFRVLRLCDILRYQTCRFKTQMVDLAISIASVLNWSMKNIYWNFLFNILKFLSMKSLYNLKDKRRKGSYHSEIYHRKKV